MKQSPAPSGERVPPPEGYSSWNDYVQSVYDATKVVMPTDDYPYASGGRLHYPIVILRPDQLDLIADAVVRKLNAYQSH